jgi:hypothetical protein
VRTRTDARHANRGGLVAELELQPERIPERIPEPVAGRAVRGRRRADEDRRRQDSDETGAGADDDRGR